MKKIITTDEENKVALSFVERLMENDPQADTDDGNLLKLLALEIQEYEKKYA